MLPITSCPLPHQIIKKKPKRQWLLLFKMFGGGRETKQVSSVHAFYEQTYTYIYTKHLHWQPWLDSVFLFVLFVFFLSRYSRNCWKFQCTRILWNGQERGCIPKIIFLERFIMFNFFSFLFLKKNTYAVVYIKNCLSLSFYLMI